MMGFDIKWRGKRLGNEKGEWLIGSLYDDSGELYILPLYPGSALDYEDCQINPNTLGLYIGRNDKYGLPIYTGDLLQDERGKIWKVEMERNMIQVVIVREGVKKDPRLFNYGECVVLGTIYD